MSAGANTALLVRSPGNPILTARDWPYPANTVFNPGAVLLPDGTTLLLCRVEDCRGHSHLCAARSANGIDGWRIDPEPTLAPEPEKRPEELWGVEDPRITFVPELGRYAVLYTSYAGSGPGVSLAMTTDFLSFQHLGMIVPPEDKDAALFPHRIDGRWALIHRPVGPTGAHIWISYSPDLRHWGSHKMILPARRGAWWDAGRVGLSTPPIETAQGWLLLCHGARDRGGMHLPPGCGAHGPPGAGPLSPALRRVALRPSGGLRVPRGRRQGGLSLRLHHRSRR